MQDFNLCHHQSSDQVAAARLLHQEVTLLSSVIHVYFEGGTEKHPIRRQTLDSGWTHDFLLYPLGYNLPPSFL